ncbi:MAG: malonyl-[acyl-carrier protein] O-methyltransferase BioC [Cycloclasticus sp. symbiont of Bathymodiolus heckerae]|nr:MAG: malonyl-[acyl-carrier protein] O-methyltransferase BioC [Cycloclasticus sp. symbiont of Bathymodiolus heckerae]
MAGVRQAVFDKQVVQQSFDLASDRYNQFTSLQRTIGDRLLERIDVCSQGNVLDIGSGTGYLTKKLTELNHADDVYALDISTGMLQQTKLNTRQSSLNGFICADAENLPLAKESIRAVYSNLAYQWCSNLGKAIGDVHDILQTDGVFAFSTFGPKTLQELKSVWATVDGAVHVNYFEDMSDIQGYLERSGFKQITVRSEDIVVHYDTPKQLMLGLKGMGAHNINQGRNKGLTGVGAFKAMLKKYEGLRVESGIPATYEAVYVYAKK